MRSLFKVSAMNSLRFLIFLFGWWFSIAHAEMVSGRVERVEDGMTLVLVDAATQKAQTIRLLGADAPHRMQAFGVQSQTALAAMAAHQMVQADCRRYDQNAQLCVVKVNGRDLGLEQVRAGMAWWYTEHSTNQSAQEREDYRQAEFMAKIHRYGLWNSTNPMPPRDWRRLNIR